MRATLYSFAVFALLLLPLPLPAMAQGAAPDSDKARAFVTALADDAIVILSSETTRAGREASFSKLLNQKANMRRIAPLYAGALRPQNLATRFRNLSGLAQSFHCQSLCQSPRGIFR